MLWKTGDGFGGEAIKGTEDEEFSDDEGCGGPKPKKKKDLGKEKPKKEMKKKMKMIFLKKKMLIKEMNLLLVNLG